MIQVQHKEIITVDYKAVDLDNPREVLAAVTMLLENCRDHYSHNTEINLYTLLKIGYLTSKFDRTKFGIRKADVAKFFNLPYPKYYHLDYIMKHFEYDIDKALDYAKEQGTWSVRRLYELVASELRQDDKFSRGMNLKLLSRKLPAYARRTIDVVTQLSGKLNAYPVQRFFLEKMQRTLNWHLPEMERIDGDEYFHYSYCCKCGKLNDDVEPYELIEYEHPEFDRKIDVPVCPKCIKLRQSIKDKYVIKMLYDYSVKLETILDGRPSNNKKYETYNTHFRRPYGFGRTDSDD